MFISKELLVSSLDPAGIVPTETEIEKLNRFAELLAEYNKKLNLTAITEPDDIVLKHFADSLYVSKYIDNDKSVCDVGSGAGFPSIPLAIMRKDLRITMMDSTEKKLKFSEFVISELDLAAETLHMRAEEAGHDPRYRESFDYTVTRAVAEMRIIAEYCIPLTAAGGKMIAMKGSKGREETERAEETIKILGGEIYNIYDYSLYNGDSREIVVIKKNEKTKKIYPRKNNFIKTRELRTTS